jgi:hypothetical protein
MAAPVASKSMCNLLQEAEEIEQAAMATRAEGHNPGCGALADWRPHT